MAPTPSMTCPSCGRALYVDSTACVGCGTLARFDPFRLAFVYGPACANAVLIGCNWVAAADGELCASCRLTRTSPNHGDPAAVAAWAGAELHKRQLVLQLLELGLPVISYRDVPQGGLAFDLLHSSDGSITVGHAAGVITIDVGEDDDARRARLRDQLGERYRTMLGHFRHEVGHYYWPLLAGRDDTIERTRALFGDERADYAAALEAHYANQAGDPAGRVRPDDYVSDYATAHPWEDWAETFAHVLHIVAVMSSVDRFDLRLGGDRWASGEPAPPPPGPRADMDRILASWVPLTVALNAINRSMGLDDLYPFVLSATVREKLTYVHRLIQHAPQEVPRF